MRGLTKGIKCILALVVTILILGGMGFAFYLVYLDSNTSAARKYLVEKYGIEEKELKPKKYIKYVYEDVTNCETEWFKKCTDNEDLEFEYVIEYNDETIIVSEDKKGILSDDAKLKPIENEEQEIDGKDNIEDKGETK